jgi:hypothetical protein
LQEEKKIVLTPAKGTVKVKLYSFMIWLNIFFWRIFYMILDENLSQLFNNISGFDVDEPFPLKVNESLCYAELGKHIILKDVKMRHFSLIEQLIEYLVALGLEEYHTTSVLAHKIKVEELIKTTSSVNPYEDLEVPELIKRLQGKVEELDSRGYIDSIMVLTELGWKLEMLGDNLVILKRSLAKFCSNYYDGIQDQSGEIALSTRAELSSRKEAVMFGTRPRLKPINMDLTGYGKLGGDILRGAQFLYFTTYHLALVRDDHIQAFRSFRKTLRIRKRFGLSHIFRDHLIEMDKAMTKASLDQMGEVADNIELRKFEVQLRSEQQVRNLKLKTIMA